MTSPKPASKSRAQSARPAKPDSRPGTAARHKIMVVDDHPMMRAGLIQLLNCQPDLVVCCEAGSPAQALQEIPRSLPDLVLTDISMPGRSGVEFIKDVRALHPQLPILVISMHDELVYAERTLRAGARGYIMKEAGGEKLLLAVRHVIAGQVYVSERMSTRLLDSLTGRQPRGSHSPIETLSDREFEVFQLIGQGKSTRDIAAHLGLSPKTVDVHRAHIKEKLSLKNATALIQHAVRWVETQADPSS